MSGTPPHSGAADDGSGGTGPADRLAPQVPDDPRVPQVDGAADGESHEAGGAAPAVAP